MQNVERTMVNQLRRHGFDMDVIEQTPTPFYCYDMNLLNRTIGRILQETAGAPYVVHYAIKANSNPHILSTIAHSGLGADVVSGGEIRVALNNGFKAENINFSGVAKTDWEIQLGLECGIGCFNVESSDELQVINDIAGKMGKTAPVAFRVNPDIDAHTHRFITTGTAANKFGIAMDELDSVIDLSQRMNHVKLLGLHFHIGSQITQMQPFVMLCDTINHMVERYNRLGIHFEHINVGGGLGIDYSSPDEHPFAPFRDYFDTFKKGLAPLHGMPIHFELGRAIVASCGTLISRVVYIKENKGKKFALIDAGMNDLIRPALYGAHHVIQNLTSNERACETYEVAGPVCESSDVFATDCQLPLTRRGDILAIRSAGAYGESMASCYNMRPLPACVCCPAPEN
ncbi:MAG: diaminopimelate decarboxylase [Muribaculaceae bacterium]|nr:diaminopimelate decarboxylase [Muribaculaceae bacterium]